MMTAMFVTIFMNQWLQGSKKKEGFVCDHISEIIGILASAAALLVFGADHFIVPALLLVLLALTLLRRKLEDKTNGGNHRETETLTQRRLEDRLEKHLEEGENQ